MFVFYLAIFSNKILEINWFVSHVVKDLWQNRGIVKKTNILCRYVQLVGSKRQLMICSTLNDLLNIGCMNQKGANMILIVVKTNHVWAGWL